MKKGTSFPNPCFCKKRSLEITLNKCSARVRRSVFVPTITPHFRERPASPSDYSPQSAASCAPTTRSAEFCPRHSSSQLHAISETGPDAISHRLKLKAQRDQDHSRLSPQKSGRKPHGLGQAAKIDSAR